MTDCARKCWIFAALMGLVVWLMAMGHGGAGVFGGLFLAFVTAWLLGGLLVLLFCGSEVEPYEPEPLRVAEPLSDADLAEAAAARQARFGKIEITRAARPEGMGRAPQGATTDPRQAVTFEPSAEVAREERVAEETPAPIELGAPAGASSDPRQAVTFEAGDRQTEGGAAQDVEARGDDAAGRRESASAPVAEVQPVGEARPATADASDDRDDLGRILGIGPVLTEWLNDNGVTRFAQIAAWSDQDVLDWGERLGRNGGRIERDDWVGQARILAAGGETEHSRRVDRGEAT
ncbi:hypothetical protein [Paracoccus sanguinis]|uniref:Predicted 5' DNA nuclease, flap endonuclease-1-like, helix-3-turn-helix (H3TH) domain n=1 Tax=Paracoccus sanguinis TaxID=1545044 RepID=A0A1H2WM48_9RHOB|nr:hypothetical protein [Paracoccus sanguinis]SDW81733.1 Predicted 5' DNA nuclease, flap endonuclease-1-like, helix-3-turn-helix (H3TH) domain [Paracoccus sanguinis]